MPPAAPQTHPAPSPPVTGVRCLVIVLGDQLDLDASAFDGFDPSCDCVWMAEVTDESTHVWSTKPRIAVFLAAMRHFAEALEALGRPLVYRRLAVTGDGGAHEEAAGTGRAPDSLAAVLEAAIARLAPQRLVMTAPGDWRVLQSLRAVARRTGLALEVRDDRHFYGTIRDFTDHLGRHRSLRMEFFYREMRQRHGVLMEGDAPAGGRWNWDTENRASFGRAGPAGVPGRLRFAPDELTRDVLALVEDRFAAHPGSLADFAWPVCREHALQALAAFIRERLPGFGRHQDAMWQGQAWLWHSQLSAALNLKLLTAREVVAAAEAAWQRDAAPLASVEGFIRQILGWREYVRGVYWTQMPGYIERNALDAHEDLPPWYWTGATDMACLRDTLVQTLTHGYAHHIQRLMVTGLYALLLGVEPTQVHAWYLAVYVDAVEWVELPNTLGMSQYADGGLMGSKPYAATGRYIDRMSNYCRGCRYDPGRRSGEDACPFTTLYWDFLTRHEALLADNPRMVYPLRQLARLEPDERRRVAERAAAIRRGKVGGAG